MEQSQEEQARTRQAQEAEFGRKRAQFMDMFKKKEEELKELQHVFGTTKKENDNLKEELHRLKTELEDFHTATDLFKQDAMEDMQLKHQQELASMQQIMEEATEGVRDSVRAQYEQERASLLKTRERLEAEVQELKSKLTQEREGFLSSVTKTLKRVGVGAQSEAENLEEHMKKAQEDAQMLKSVVLPLEEEIESLKTKLREYEGQVKELNHSLEVEKSSRTDLEMYTAVLNTQKSVLQDDNDKLRKELHEVCRLLEKEQKEHNDLKLTWQMANDQFLESQRLMMMDMRRMESVLSAEQQRQIAEMQKKDQDREAQEKKVRDLEQQRKEQEQRIADEEKQRQDPTMSPPKGLSPESDQDGSFTGSKTSLNSLQQDDLLNFFDTDNRGEGEGAEIPKSFSSSHIANFSKEISENSGLHETKSLQGVDGAGSTIRPSPDRIIHIPGLTQEQQKALKDPTPEHEASKSLVATVKSRSDTINLAGKRTVSEREWLWLQDELKAARAKLGRPCDMCNNYEAQLVQVQKQEQEAQEKIKSFERQLDVEKRALEATTKLKEELEETLKTAAEQTQQQIATLNTKVQESERFMSQLRQQYSQAFTDLQEQLKTLTETREEIQKELTQLQEENDALLGRHSKTAQQLQNEEINLPNNVEEMQLLLLKYKEEIIAAKVAKEHVEHNLKSEIMFLKDQILAEQQERANVEEEMSREVNSLQEQLALLQSVKSELERESKVRLDLEAKLKEVESQLKSSQAKSSQLISGLQSQLAEQNTKMTKLEEDLMKARSKVSSLQVDLDNSEAVQRDFVKLSQSLQIQLEKIRQSENEVRWQHEEDTDECTGCSQPFSVTKRKHHCRHCGRIFCSDCTAKTVVSGPNLRQSKVCDVCHTILVKDATPFFSTEPPPS
ncbi:rab GTPase-binding effector protein 1-like isoform X2 [Lingula anatina]|uniref:Rab GTPase-binding effector protein 1-like isoform X2 n=1 Tax=Lingula anatina TaxID=7574 RepID=A0A1S3HU14_LINAN|nr:rab GTPase-binding effector protein 1-like isoform X2 [Lingula anatina]|eukprot:XP_013389532.1 rab GTPase-binding effector protein 1-like isoform X2 [Lingula anatina]